MSREERGVGLVLLVALLGFGLLFWLMAPRVVIAGDCYEVPITINTPTGIAGCEEWGSGIASHYGPGSGVAMNFCTWSADTAPAVAGRRLRASRPA